ncbi:hypothetical protein GF389_05860 [Candidatus Dojkabacteria bacterium]|nr:hypothetical protein [Candidatus Dojkabacteria bacterium]
MKSKLTRFEKLFLTSNNLMWAGNYVFDVILAFFIWGESQNLNNLLVFKLFWTIGIVGGAFSAVYLMVRLHPIIIRIASFLLAVIFAVSILFLNVEGKFILILLGAIYGFKVGLGSQPYNLIYQMLIRPENRLFFSSLQSAIHNFVLIFFPFVVTQIIDITENYDIVFILAIILTILSIFPLFSGLKSYKNGKQRDKTDFSGAYQEIKQSKNLQNLLALKFIDGIQNGFEIAVFPVLGLYIVSDVGSWGIVNTIFAVLTVFLYFTVAKKLSFKKAAPVFNVVAVVYSLVALLFGVYLTLELYLLFLIVLVLDRTLINTVYSAIDSKIVDRRVEETDHLDEYLTIAEIPLFLGRVVPLLGLLLAGGQIDGVAMSLVLVLVAFLPMAMTYILGRIDILKRAEDPFIASD